MLDPDVLTIGFARRVPTYKRLTLMLRDRARLKALLLHPERPVQLVIAGKSHPADDGGKRMIQELVRFTDDPEVRHRIVFLPNYDIAMAQHPLPGLRRVAEQPAAAAGGLRHLRYEGRAQRRLESVRAGRLVGRNVSTATTAGRFRRRTPPPTPGPTTCSTRMSGTTSKRRRSTTWWKTMWRRVFTPRRYPKAPEPPARPTRWGTDKVPHQWIAMIKHTLANLGPAVSAERMLQDYVEQLYRPASTSGHAARADDFAAAKELAAWTSRVRNAWGDVSVEHVDSMGITDEPQIGESLTVNAYVRLGPLAPDSVIVQVVHGQVTENDDLAQTSTDDLTVADQLGDGRYLFTGPVTIDRSGSFGYSVRVLPRHPALANQAELGLVANATN